MRRYGEEAENERGPNGGFYKMPRKFDFSDYGKSDNSKPSESIFQKSPVKPSFEQFGFKSGKQQSFEDLMNVNKEDVEKLQADDDENSFSLRGNQQGQKEYDFDEGDKHKEYRMC